MKKLLSLFLSLMVIICSFVVYSVEKNNDANYMQHFLESAETVDFYIRREYANIDKASIINEFEMLKDKYNASIFHTTTIHGITYKTGIYTDEFIDEMEKHIYSGSLPSNKNEYLASFTSEDINQTGIIFDLFNDNPIVIQQLYKVDDTYSLLGRYTIISDDIDLCLDELSFFFDVSQEDLQTETYVYVSMKGTLYYLGIICLLILFVLYSLLCFYYPLSKLKEIGILKLMGYKTFDIWMTINKRLYIFPVFIMALILLFEFIFLSNLSSMYIFHTVLMQLLVIILCMMVTFLQLIVIKKYKTQNMLKGYFIYRLPIYVCYVLKFAIVVFLIITVPLLGDNLISLKHDYNLMTAYKDHSDYLTLSSYKYIGDEMMKELNGDYVVRTKIINMYKELEETANAGYVYFFEAKDDFDNRYPVMEVNQNYLERLGIQSRVPINDKVTIVSPRGMYSEEILEDICSRYLSDKEINIEYYSENINVFCENNIDSGYTNLNGLSNKISKAGYCDNPIFIYMDQNMEDELKLSINVSAIQNPIRIKDTEENRNRIKEAIIHANLSENSVEFSSVFDTGYKENMEMLVEQIEVNLLSVSSILFVGVISSYFIILFLLKIKNKEIIIKKLLGFSLYSRNREVYQYVILMDFLGVFRLFLSKINVFSIVLLLFFVCIDFLIMCSLQKYFENRQLATSLKGEF